MLTFICIASFASSAAMRISLVPCEIIQLREWSGFNVCMCCVSVRARMPIHSIQLNHYRINYMLLWCSMFFLQIPFQIYYFFTLFCCCCSHSCFYLLCACVRFFRSVDGFHFHFGRRARNERVRVNPDIWNNFDFIFRFYVCAHGCVCDCVCVRANAICAVGRMYFLVSLHFTLWFGGSECARSHLTETESCTNVGLKPDETVVFMLYVLDVVYVFSTCAIVFIYTSFLWFLLVSPQVICAWFYYFGSSRINQYAAHINATDTQPRWILHCQRNIVLFMPNTHTYYDTLTYRYFYNFLRICALVSFVINHSSFCSS